MSDTVHGTEQTRAFTELRLVAGDESVNYFTATWIPALPGSAFGYTENSEPCTKVSSGRSTKCDSLIR